MAKPMGAFLRGRWTRVRETSFSFSSILIVVFLVASASTPAVAQGQSPSGDAEPRSCRAVAGTTAEDGSRQVYALCGGINLPLGTADSFQSFANPELEATIVEIEHLGDKRVLLLRPDAEELVMREDLTGTLGAAAGRAPWVGVEGLSLGYTAFAASGVINVAAAMAEVAGRGEAAEGLAGSPGVIEFSIGEHIAEDEARLAAAEAEQAEAQ